MNDGLIRAVPISFRADMIERILAAKKTQTRRIMTKQPPKGLALKVGRFYPTRVGKDGVETPGELTFGAYDDEGEWGLRCPYGAPGSLLWVREPWSAEDMGHNGVSILYKIDGSRRLFGWDRLPKGWTIPKVCSPRFMPRAIARLILKTTGVRAEPVGEIGQADVKAEGLTGVTKDGTLIKWGLPDKDGLPGNDDIGWPWSHWEADPKKAYARLWDTIHPDEPDRFQDSPTVWVLDFSVTSQIGWQGTSPDERVLLGIPVYR